MATEPVRRKCASSPTPDGREGWQGIALERAQVGETDEEFRADVEFMEARGEKVLEELRKLLGQFRHRSYSGLWGQEFLMTSTTILARVCGGGRQGWRWPNCKGAVPTDSANCSRAPSLLVGVWGAAAQSGGGRVACDRRREGTEK
jgi:hypothetical protein